MKAQIEFCIENDNMDHLFRSVPRELWNEFHGNPRQEPSKKSYETIRVAKVSLGQHMSSARTGVLSIRI